MDDQNAHQRQGALDAKGRRQALPLAEGAACGSGAEGHDPLRARLVDGLAADLRPEVPGRPRFLGDGVVRRSAASTPGAWTTRATAAPTSRARSTATSPNGADDLEAGSQYILQNTGAKKLLVYGISSGALKAALFAAAPSRARRAPGARRLRLDRRGQPDARRAQEDACPSSSRRTAGRSTARSCAASSTATIPAAADEATIEAFATAILALDDSVPTGTYVDMCSKLPLVDPAKIKRADHRHARRVRRHRGHRGSARVLRACCRTPTSSSR